jgi:hypothetical protein
MTTSHDISADVIAQLVASYTQPELPTFVKMVKVSNGPTKKQSKLSVAKAAAKAAEVVGEMTEGHNQVKREVIPFILPEVGTYDAKGYMKQMVRAHDRNERIAAIAGYVGYDTTISYSANELSANLRAKQTLRGNVVALPRPVHSAPTGPTLSGYVSGLPNATDKRRQDLKGREVVAAEAMLDHNKAAAAHLLRGDQANAHHAATLAQVECERLSQIQRDLETL